MFVCLFAEFVVCGFTCLFVLLFVLLVECLWVI